MDQYRRQLLDMVKTALEEDIGQGDVTSLACLQPEPVNAEIIAKSNGVLSGEDAVIVAFQMVDPANRVAFNVHDGKRFRAGDRIARVEGFNQTIMTTERTALNFLGHLSGVATLTRQFADLIKTTECKVLDTRKTLPGFRHLEKRAVIHGGGHNHRIGLYDMLLIKDNHIAAAGSITDAVGLAREYLADEICVEQFSREGAEFEIEVEVSSEMELTEALEVGITRLLLDNQSVERLAALVSVAHSINPRAKLEASGNVNLDNVAAIATTGVDYISIGAITHSAPNADFSLRVIE